LIQKAVYRISAHRFISGRSNDMPPDRQARRGHLLNGSGSLLSQAGILTEVMQAFLIGALLAIPVCLSEAKLRLFLSVWLAGSWLLLWLVRLVVRRIWQFVCAALAIAVSPLLLPAWLGFQLPLLHGIFLVAALAVLGIRSFAQKLNQEQEQAPKPLTNQFLALALFWSLAMAADQFKLSGLVTVYFYMAIIYLLLAVVRWHGQSLDEQLARFVHMPTQPAARIFRFNRILLFGFTGSLLVLLLLSPWLHLHELIPLLGRQLLVSLAWLLKQLLALINRVFTRTDPEQTALPSETIPLPVQPQVTPVWLVILLDIISYLLIACGCLFLLGLLLYSVISIYRRFYAARQSGPDMRESLLPNIKDQLIERVRRSSGSLQQRFGMDPGQRIRRLYSRYIQKGNRVTSVTLHSNLTARQIAEWITLVQPETIQEITALYEKARYGNDLCVQDDVRRMQYLCSRAAR
jgi:hypothetical protein